MFDNFAGQCEKVFYRSHRDGVGRVRSSLGECMKLFAIERLNLDKEMNLNLRAMNVVKDAQRQNDDKALSS